MGEEFKVPHYASTAAACDGNLPYIIANCLYSQHRYYKYFNTSSSFSIFIIAILAKFSLYLLGIKANGYYIRQVAVTYRCGTSVVRNLKFLTPFFNSQQLSFLTITITYLSSCYWWVTLYNQHWLVVKHTVNHKTARFLIKEIVLCRGAICAYKE